MKRQRMRQLEIVPVSVRGHVRFKLAGYYVDGKRIRKFFKSQKAAETFVKAETIRRTNLGNRATRIDGALAEDALRAADLLKPIGYTLLDAARLVADAHTKLQAHSVLIPAAIAAHVVQLEEAARSVTIETLIAEFIQNRRAKGKSPSYIRDLESRLGRLQSSMGTRLVSDVTATDVEAWIHSLNVGPQTQNNFRAVLSAAWTFAVRRGYAAGNVVQLVDKAEVVRDHVPIFTVDQLAALLRAASPSLSKSLEPNDADAAIAKFLPVLAIGAFAGLRPEEIKKLHWENIDFDERTIRVNASASKTRKKRFAELSDNLAAWLKPYVGRIGAVAPPNLQKLRLATMRRAGIARWPQDVLRHSFASAHYAFHKNPAHTAMLLGHRDQNMLLTHYRDLMKPTEAARYWSLAPHVNAAGKIVAFRK